jgi:hypothetical protein
MTLAPRAYACGLMMVLRASYHGPICGLNFKINCSHNCSQIRAGSGSRLVTITASQRGWYRCSMTEVSGFAICGLAMIPTTVGVLMASFDWETRSHHLMRGRRTSDIRTGRTDDFRPAVPISINLDAASAPANRGAAARRFHAYAQWRKPKIQGKEIGIWVPIRPEQYSFTHKCAPLR